MYRDFDGYGFLPVIPQSTVVLPSARGITHPTKEQQTAWATEFGHYDLALPLNDNVLVYANVEHSDVRTLVQLFLDDVPPFAWRIDNGNLVEVYWLGQQSQPQAFVLNTEENVRLVECYLDIATFDARFQLDLSQLQEPPKLPSQLLALFHGGLLEASVKLAADIETKPILASEKARSVQSRLYCASTIHMLFKGERTLMETIEVVTTLFPTQRDAVPFLFSLIRDRITRHNKRLPLDWDKGITEHFRKKYKIPFHSKDGVWSYTELQTYMRKAIAQNLHDTLSMATAVRECLSHMAAAQIDNIQAPLLLKFLSSQSGLQVPPSALRKQLNDLKQIGELQTHADIAVDYHKTLTLVTEYKYGQSRFWQWSGSHWTVIPDSILLAQISQEYGSLQAARRAGDHMGILRVLSGVMLQEIEYEQMIGINFANGFLNDKLELKNHDPAFNQTHTLISCYDPNATDMPLFNKFLFDCWGGDSDYEDKKRALQEMFAVTLFGCSRQYQRAFLLFGVPKSGKSQLLNIISRLIPLEGQCSVNPSDWHDRFRPALMANKRLNLVGELSERHSIDGQKFKDIVDGTTQMSEFKGRDAFTFTPMCAHWFASNHLPKTRDTSDGFYRRWLILAFNQPVPSSEKIIRDLGMLIVAKERDAILAWAAQGILRVKDNCDYTLPESHIDNVNQMASQNNSLAFFMLGSGLLRLIDPSLKTKRLTPEQRKNLSQSKDYILGDTLYSIYSQWCIGDAGVRPVSSSKFHTQMREMAAVHGFIQNRIKFRTGLMGYSYVNLTCNSQPVDSIVGSDVTVTTDPYMLN